MGYAIEYYAHGREDRQPAEEFEDALCSDNPRLLGKLQGVTSRERTGEPTPHSRLQQASGYWNDYQRTRRVSPEVPE